MIFQFSSPVLLTGWEVFHWLISCPVFFLNLTIIGLGGFSLETWSFETHQLFYGARMFSVILRFSSPVSLIGLGAFSPCSHSSLQWFPRSAEFASKKGGNCNNVNLKAGAKSFWSRSHVTTINQNFILVNLTSTAMPHLVGLPFEATVLSHPIHSTTYTWLLIVYAVGRYFRLWELSVFYPLVQKWGLSFFQMSLDGVELSCQLDATRPSFS